MPPAKDKLARWLWLLLVACILLVAWFLKDKLIKDGVVGTGTDPVAYCFDPQGSLPWPVPASEGLGSGYLQFELAGEAPTPHVGVDVLAAAGTTVTAIEGGRVVLEKGADPYHYLVIESATKPGFGFRYMHVSEEEAYDLVDVTDVVEAGKEIASVVKFTPDASGGYDHLHVEAVRGYGSGGLISSAGEDWEDCESIENPLRQLAPLSDATPPQILLPTADEYALMESVCAASTGSPEAWPFWFRKEAEPLQTSSYLCPQELPKGTPLDIICRIEDRYPADAGLVVSPCCGSVKVTALGTGDIAFERTFVFDGVSPGEGEGQFLSFVHDGTLDSVGYFSGSRVLYLIVTNDPGTNDWWKPDAAGEYEVTIELLDAAGHASSRSMIVTVTDS